MAVHKSKRPLIVIEARWKLYS